MSSQNIVLLGLGIFVGLIVGVVAVDQYLLDEHDPMEPAGLIWRVQTALSRVKDLEAVLEIRDESEKGDPVRVLTRFLIGKEGGLSIRYLNPEQMRGELFTVERDLLSHYIPQENLIVAKRWVGFPLAALGLASFDLTQLEKDWQAGKVELEVTPEICAFRTDIFLSTLSLPETIATHTYSLAFSFCPGVECYRLNPLPGVANVGSKIAGSSIQGGYILKVRDQTTGRLLRMIYIDRENFLVKKVVFFVDGQRTRSIYVQRIAVNQGLSPEEIHTLPHGATTVRS